MNLASFLFWALAFEYGSQIKRRAVVNTLNGGEYAGAELQQEGQKQRNGTLPRAVGDMEVWSREPRHRHRRQQMAE